MELCFFSGMYVHIACMCMCMQCTMCQRRSWFAEKVSQDVSGMLPQKKYIHVQIDLYRSYIFISCFSTHVDFAPGFKRQRHGLQMDNTKVPGQVRIQQDHMYKTYMYKTSTT